MPVSNNPIPSIPLSKLGVTDSQFVHQSNLHGQGHVNRVIYNIFALTRTMGLSRWLVPAWAAAYLHDLSRRHDGVCYNHGEWAVLEQWERYLPFFRSAGLQPEDDIHVQHAVRLHSYPYEPQQMHPVTALLKDADGLDRCRLGDLDPRYLRLERTPGLIKYAAVLFDSTRRRNDWDTVWNVARPIFNPHLGAAERIKESTATEEPQKTMIRRVRQGQFYKLAKQVMGLSWKEIKQKVEDIPALLGFVEELIESSNFAGGEPVTYMPEDKYDAFLKDGEWKSFWELDSATWHTEFNDSPADARAYNEQRLFGEKARFLTHGVYSLPRVFGDSDSHLRRMYGPVRVHWNPSVLPFASFTINDSQTSMYVLPFHVGLMEKVIALQVIAGALLRVGRPDTEIMQMIPQLSKPLYVELQIHAKLSPDDVKAVVRG